MSGRHAGQGLVEDGRLGRLSVDLGVGGGPRRGDAEPAAHARQPAVAAADLLSQPARTRRPRVREDWEGFFTLVAERNGEQPDRFGEPTANLEELLFSIGLDDLFLTMPAHPASTYPAATPLVTAFRTTAQHTITTRDAAPGA